MVYVAPNERMSGVSMVVETLERTGTNALPYINTPSFWVPDTTLGEHVPVDVELPDPRCVADDGWHDDVDSWVGVLFERGEWGSEEAGLCEGEVHGVSSSRDGDGKNYKGYL